VTGCFKGKSILNLEIECVVGRLDAFSRITVFYGNNLSSIAFLILSNAAEVIRKTEFFFYKVD